MQRRLSQGGRQSERCKYIKRSTFSAIWSLIARTYLNYTTIKMYTTFPSQPPKATVSTHMHTAHRLPPAHSHHAVNVPSGKSWTGSPHGNRDATLKSHGPTQVVDLTGDDKSYEARAGYAHRAKDGNGNNTDRLPSLEQPLRKEKCKRTLSPKRKTGEHIHNSNTIDRLGPKSSNNNYPGHSQKRQFGQTSDRTTQKAREDTIHAIGMYASYYHNTTSLTITSNSM